jgi:hypothetical protein
MIRGATDEDLRAIGERLRAEAEAHRSAHAPPAPINVRNALAFLTGACENLPFRHFVFAVEPISMAEGLRLLSLAQDHSDNPGPESRAALASCIWGIVRPRGVRGFLLRTLLRRWNPFGDASDRELSTFVAHLHAAPDESDAFAPLAIAANDTSATRVPLNFNKLILFVGRQWPHLIDSDTGMPRTWRAFIYGLRYMPEAEAAMALMIASAAAVPNMKADDQRLWYARHRQTAGL